MTENRRKDIDLYKRPTGAAAVVVRICNILFIAILLSAILCAGTILTAQIFGYKPLAILSGSMEPNYHVNGLIIVDTNINPENVKIGDVIAFNLNESTVVTHRVIEIDPESQLFTTKGDANETIDAPVSFDALVGATVLHIPTLGKIAMSIHTRTGLAVGLIAIAVLVILFVVPILLAPAQNRPCAAPEFLSENKSNHIVGPCMAHTCIGPMRRRA